MRTRFNAIVDRFHVYDLDLKAARLAAEIDAELHRAGEAGGPVDIEIAAIALTNDETLLTNDRDFDVIEEIFGLRTEGY